MIDVDGSKESYVDEKGIDRSDIFVVVFSKHFIEDPLRMEELEFAKKKKKRIAVVILDDMDPDPYLKGANVIMKRYVNRKSNQKLQHELIADFAVELTELLEQTK